VSHLSVTASLSSAHIGFLNFVVCFVMNGLTMCSNFENCSGVIRSMFWNGQAAHISSAAPSRGTLQRNRNEYPFPVVTYQ